MESNIEVSLLFNGIAPLFLDRVDHAIFELPLVLKRVQRGIALDRLDLAGVNQFGFLVGAAEAWTQRPRPALDASRVRASVGLLGLYVLLRPHGLVLSSGV